MAYISDRDFHNKNFAKEVQIPVGETHENEMKSQKKQEPISSGALHGRETLDQPKEV